MTRLFSFSDDRDVGSSYLFGTDGLGIDLGRGVRVGRIVADGLVEVETGQPGPITRRIEDLRPAPAVPRPGKIVAVGLNYRDHVAEQGIPTPDRPMLFAKFANAVVADGAPIVRPRGTHALDLEVELGVVIGRLAHRVAAADAMDHVAGYVVCNDVSARDWQGSKPALLDGERGDGQWLRAKGSDTFLPMGPVFVTADEIPDPHALRLRSWRIPGPGQDGAGEPQPMQDGTTADMLFRIPELIAFVSAAITLEPGDLLITGTPAGVGVFRDPPVFLEPGDRARCEIDGIGMVENPIVDAPADARRHVLALVKTAPEPGLTLTEVPDPRPGINDVLIRVHRTGICGTDLHIASWDAWAARTIRPPLVVGHEFVGEIVEVGSNVDDFGPGDLVSGEGHVVCGRCRHCLAGRRHLCAAAIGLGVGRDGAFAEYVVLPMTNIWHHWPGVDPEVAAIFDPFGNAVHTALAFPTLGEDVLVSGAGPIGLMATAVVRHAGARHVVVSEPNPFRRELAHPDGRHDRRRPAGARPP